MPFPATYSAREDSGSANNPALNLTTADAIELTFIAETDTGGAGDLILDQPTGGGVDPDTQVEIGGTSYSFTYELSGTMPTQKKDGAQQVPDQYEGSDVVIITVEDYPSAGETTRYAFMPNESASLVDMDDFGNGAIDVQNVDETPDPTPICFLKGSLIRTPHGDVPVEDLAVGDLVMTLDDGPMPIKWISFTEHRWPGTPDRCVPVLIPAGALGDGRPQRDLAVSPQHRMLLKGNDVKRSFGRNEVLIPAKGLIGFKGCRAMKGKREANYYHVLLDRHCIVKAEGAFAESFFPGTTALKMMTRQQRKYIYDLFPGLLTDTETGYGPMARHSLSYREAATLLKTRLKVERVNAGKVENGNHHPADPALAAR